MPCIVRALWLLACAALSGCELLNLDQFPLAHCTASSDCAQLNSLHGIMPGACMSYGCMDPGPTSGLCVLGPLDQDGDGDSPTSCPGGTDCDDNDPTRAGTLQEHCDGVDNDCNDVIDDGVVAPRNRTAAIMGVTSLARVSYSAASEGTALAAYSAGLGTTIVGAINTLTGASASPATPDQLGYVSLANDTTTTTTDTAAALTSSPGCVQSDAQFMLPHEPVMCSVADVSAAQVDSDGDAITATVNTTGCPEGQLRIGYRSGGMNDGTVTTPAASIVLRGPPARSNVYLGIDVDPSTRYCTRDSATLIGVTRPTVSGLQIGMDPQALVAYLGAPLTTPVCGTGPGNPVPVKVIGTWLATGLSSGDMVRWVVGTNDGEPQSLGETAGGGAPALAGWTTTTQPGWFAAFGNATGQLEIHFVTGQPGSIPGLGPIPTVDTDASAVDLACVSPGLAISATHVIPTSGTASVDQVALAIGSIDSSGGIDLAATWEENCSSPTLYFERLHYDPSGTGTWTDGTPIELDATPSVGPAAIAYVPSGFVTSEFVRGGVTANAATGGWVVTWQTAGPPAQIVARRIAEFDGQPIMEPNIVLNATTDSMPQAPFVYPQDSMAADVGLLHFAYATAAGFTGGDLLCGPGATIAM